MHQRLLLGLTDTQELDEIAAYGDVLGALYPRTLLYLISNALEGHRDVPVLGMQTFLMDTKFGTERAAFSEVYWVPATMDNHEINRHSHGGFSRNADIIE